MTTQGAVVVLVVVVGYHWDMLRHAAQSEK